MIRRPPRSTQSRSSAASDVYKRQGQRTAETKRRCRTLLQAKADELGAWKGTTLTVMAQRPHAWVAPVAPGGKVIPFRAQDAATAGMLLQAKASRKNNVSNCRSMQD